MHSRGLSLDFISSHIGFHQSNDLIVNTCVVARDSDVINLFWIPVIIAQTVGNDLLALPFVAVGDWATRGTKDKKAASDI